LAQFFEDFRGLYQGFVQRHDTVMRIFKEESSSFVTVFAPNESSVEVASFFESELIARDLPRAGFIANQLHRCEGTSHDAKMHLESVMHDGPGDEKINARVLARLGMAHRRLHQLWLAEQAQCTILRKHVNPRGFFQSVPKFEAQVHDLSALEQVAETIFGEHAENLG